MGAKKSLQIKDFLRGILGWGYKHTDHPIFRLSLRDIYMIWTV